MKQRFAQAVWFKSSSSTGGGQQGDCVEIAVIPGLVGVRDSKNPDGTVLELTRGEWAAFIRTFV